MRKGLVISLFVLCFFMGVIAQEKEVKAVIETNIGNIVVKLYNDTPQHRDNFIRLVKAGHYDNTLFYRAIKNFIIQGGSSDSRDAIKGQNIGFGKPVTIIAEIQEKHYHKKGALAAPRQPDRENFFKESDISQFYIVHGRKHTPEELKNLINQVNVPIKKAIQRKYYTPEKKVILDSLRKQKKVAEFREIANKIKQDIAFDWNANNDKIYVSDEKQDDFINLGGVHHLDKEYTVFGEVVEGLEIVDKIATLSTDKNDRPLKDIKIKVRILNE